jgi:hypothetical protein
MLPHLHQQQSKDTLIEIASGDRGNFYLQRIHLKQKDRVKPC